MIIILPVNGESKSWMIFSQQKQLNNLIKIIHTQ